MRHNDRSNCPVTYGGAAAMTEPSDYPRSGTQKARDETILSVFRSADDPYLSTSEVAEQLPIGQRATHNRLEDLEERGVLRKKSVGAGSIWRINSDESDTQEASKQHRLTTGKWPLQQSYKKTQNIQQATGGWSLLLTIGVAGFSSSALLLLLIIAITMNGMSLLFFDLGVVLAIAVVLATVGLVSFVGIGLQRVFRRLGGLD